MNRVEKKIHDAITGTLVVSNPQSIDLCVSKIAEVVRKSLTTRDAQLELLGKYSEWLMENGYIEDYWQSEPPFPIDEFIKTIQSE